MPGKLCDGNDNVVNNFNTSQTFCEGRVARSLEFNPTNPYTAGTPEADAWDRGVASKAASEPNGCCADSGPPAPAA